MTLMLMGAGIHDRKKGLFAEGLEMSDMLKVPR